RCRRRMAAGRVLDVPGHEPGPARARRAQRVDVQPKLRRATGQGRTDAPGVPAGRRGHRGRRPPGQPGRPLNHEGSTAMDKFTVHSGTAIPLRRSNVDTDQIIPAVYLKRVTRSGFEDGLFSAWRTNEPDF